MGPGKDFWEEAANASLGRQQRDVSTDEVHAAVRRYHGHMTYLHLWRLEERVSSV